MSFNRIAIYGHRGWVGSPVLRALAATGAPIKVIHRAGSDVSALPAGVQAAEVNMDDPESIVPALQDVDIVLSFAARDVVPKQHNIVKAIPRTGVKLFVPSDLAFRVEDDQGLRIPANKAKHEVLEAARAAGVPTAVVLVGCFTESSLAFPILGVDVPGNRIIFTGDSAKQQLSLCTRPYVAQVYASIFARTPPSQLSGRAIGISEFLATGQEIASLLRERHGGVAPQVFHHSLSKVDEQIERDLESGKPTALSWYCRKTWGLGNVVKNVGGDVWDVEGYRKVTLREILLEEGRLEPYKDVPPQVAQLFYNAFRPLE
ncbi:NAD(P)-binding protein [Xylariaceae sp. FL0594]|nr:NAD(P)-binding protein [Xylariaceae sp. FL0594]